MGRPKIKTPMPKGSRLSEQPDPDAILRKRGKGRPSAYKPEFAQRVTPMCLLGLTNEELAVAFETNLETLAGWIEQHDEFRLAIREGREGADEQVARALYLKARGYEHPHDDIRVVSCAGANAGSEIVITPTIKRYAPSEQAAQMWLHCRQRKRFDFGNQGGAGFDPVTTATLLREMFAAAEEEDTGSTSNGSPA